MLFGITTSKSFRPLKVSQSSLIPLRIWYCLWLNILFRDFYLALLTITALSSQFLPAGGSVLLFPLSILLKGFKSLQGGFRRTHISHTPAPMVKSFKQICFPWIMNSESIDWLRLGNQTESFESPLSRFRSGFSSWDLEFLYLYMSIQFLQFV